MSVEENTALVLRYYAECPEDDGDPEKKRARRVVDEILTPDFTMYYNGDGDEDAMRGRDEHKDFLVSHTGAFGGEHWTVETMVADENTVACQCRGRATDSETKSPIDLLVADFFTVRDGRLAVLRRFLDVPALNAQRSATPASEPAGA